MKKKLALTAFALFATWGALQVSTPAAQAANNCDNVRCMSCPEGYHLKLKWPNCCECIPN